MDPQAFDSHRRVFLLASAVAAASAAASLVSCASPQGMQRPRGSGEGLGENTGGDRSATRKTSATTTTATTSTTAKPAPSGQAAAEPAGATPKDQAAASEPVVDPAKIQPPVERPVPPTSEPAIRVKTGGLPKAEPKVQISGPGPSVWIVEPGSQRAGVVAQSPVEFAWTGSGWKVTEAAGSKRAKVVAVPARATLEVTALRNEPQWLKVRATKWPGTVRLIPQVATTAAAPEMLVDIVHEVPMETYLSGVIARELFNKWTVNTHQAQAIAARSWALCEIERWRDRRHFDVVAGEAGQAWIGTTAHQKSLDAVAATRGRVLLYDARVVPAYYSSCCGGQRASARDAISSSLLHDIAPLQVSKGDAKDCCSSSPTYRWRSTVGVAGFERALPAWARVEGLPALCTLNGIRRVDILARNPAGRPVSFNITDAKGTVRSVPAERLRYALNADPAKPTEMRPAKDRVKSANFEPLVLAGELVITGRGHGHGVGMCQYGAEAMAKKGAKPEVILARYYPGAIVASSYS